MPHFEQSNVDSCLPNTPLEIPKANYPWISETTVIPTFLVTLHDGTEFCFGSLIGLNKTVEKIAANISSSDSSSTQSALFMGLPDVLQGLPASGISKVENSKLPVSSLFIASRNLVRSAGLVFAIQTPEAASELPTVLRLGISTSSDRPRLLAVMGIHQTGGKRRQI